MHESRTALKETKVNLPELAVGKLFIGKQCTFHILQPFLLQLKNEVTHYSTESRPRTVKDKPSPLSAK